MTKDNHWKLGQGMTVMTNVRIPVFPFPQLVPILAEPIRSVLHYARLPARGRLDLSWIGS